MYSQYGFLGEPEQSYGLLGDPPIVSHAQIRSILSQGLPNAPQPQQVAPAPMPQPRQAPAPEHLGFLGGLRRSLTGGDAPAGYEGLLSDQEIRAARPGLLESIFQPAGQPSKQWTERLDHAVGLKSGRAALLKQQQLDAARQQIATRYPIPQGASPDQIANALRGMYAEYARIGDTEMIAKMNSLAPSLFDQQKAQNGDWVDFGGYKALMSPQGKELQRVQKTPNPRDPNAPDTAQQLRDQRMFTRAQQLGDDYRNQTKQFATVADNIAGLNAVAPAAKSGNPAAQMSVIFQYMKLLDPGSTVREGEYANAENTRGVPDHIRNLYNKVREGAFLTPEQVDNFVGQAGTLGGVWQKRLGTVIKQYNDRAKRWGVDPNDVVYDYFGNALAPSAALNPTGAGNAGNIRKFVSPR